MNKKKTFLLVIFLIMIPFISSNNTQITVTKSEITSNQVDNLASKLLLTPNVDPFFTLVFKTYDGSYYPDYANYLKQQLAVIGINIDISLHDWPEFLDLLFVSRDFDVTSIGFGGSKSDIDDLLQGAYTENGSLNLWGYDESMDWNTTLGTGLNEWYIQNGSSMIPPNSQERFDHYWNWQQYMMDELLLLTPLFNSKSFSVNWANLDGFNFSNGDVLHNWGHMSWDGTHTGQSSTSQIVISDNGWTELNPIFCSDAASQFVIDACLDKLIYWDTDCSFYSHLAESWNFINNTTLDITLREDIEWMDYGGFTNEYLDAKDLYFTLYCLRDLSIYQYDYEWIKDLEILDDMTLRVYIDKDDSTPENDPYSASLANLATNILPEHYLNQTQLGDGVTPNSTHTSWTDFSSNCWGTGLFEIDSFTEAVATNLTVRSDCWLLDPLVDKSNMDFVNRFGDFSGGLNHLRVRIMDNDSIIFTEFEAGKLDIIDNSDFDNRVQYGSDSNFEIQSKPDQFFNYYGFNVRETRGTPLQSTDPCPFLPSMTKGLAIRKAIAFITNRTELNNEANDDSFVVHDYPTFGTLGDWLDDDIIKYNYNLTKAKEYMMYAGYDCGLDSDGDGLTDYIELNTTNTDRFNADTDSDLMPDGWEVNNGLDPLVDDAGDDEDSDGLSNVGEYNNNTDPNDADTDNDTLLDGWEVTYGLDPLIDDASNDIDNDYLSNLEEYTEGTIPNDADTDKDLLFDGHEVNGIYSPSNPGADISGYVFTDPLLADTDSDGYIDSVELYSDSDPNDPNSYPLPEFITITPPPETITENKTVTTTVTSGILFSVSIATIGLVLSIAVIFSRKIRKK
ncbi:MAG: hypothetical protein FK733_19180 [Asgard group archaeon]|nr:hypothetical protein [Asgard group archaeon]